MILCKYSFLVFFMFIVTTITDNFVLAEYRSYQYLLTGNSKEQKSLNVITSTLSPVALVKYHNVSKDKIYLLRTWMCPGNTSHQKICAPPYQQENLQSYLNTLEGVTP